MRHAPYRIACLVLTVGLQGTISQHVGSTNMQFRLKLLARLSQTKGSVN